MSSQYEYDLFVIGAGSGGVRAARMAAAQGIRVAVAEESAAGGTCVNIGCVPKKLYVHAGEFSSSSNYATGFGWSLENKGFDWSTLRDNKTATITAISGRMANVVTNSGAELLNGRARIIDPHSVEVNGRHYSAERILVTTGAKPTMPTFSGHEHLLCSDQVFDLEQLPEQMVIVGGGYIATEFAGIFNALGVKVTQLYRGELFLRGFDAEVREFVARHMRDNGIDLRFKCDVNKLEKTPEGRFKVYLNDGSSIDTDLVFAATGRHPNSAGIGLEEVGVKLGPKGEVQVNNQYQTSVPSIYALGDIIDRMQLTPVALEEAMTLLRNLYTGDMTPCDYDLIPTAVFSSPSFSSVGLTEEQAIEQYAQVDVYTTSFKALKHSLSGSKSTIMMKLLVNAEDQKVIGAHMAGEGAAETIQGLAIALKAGATKQHFDQTIGIHPTSAEEFVTMREVTRTHRK